VKRLCQLLEVALGKALTALVAAMVLTVGWQVLSRLLARASVALSLPLLVEPSRWTEELAGFQLAWLALLGAVYALRRREHPGFDLVHDKLPAAGRRLADLVASGLVAAFSLLVLGYGGARLVAMTLDLGQTTPALGWPMGFVYTVIPASGLLMGLFAIEELAERWRGEAAEPLSRGDAV